VDDDVTDAAKRRLADGATTLAISSTGANATTALAALALSTA
jgi:hypothetical protein